MAAERGRAVISSAKHALCGVFECCQPVFHFFQVSTRAEDILSNNIYKWHACPGSYNTNRCGVDWNGMEWGGVECNGVEWSGEGWGGKAWRGEGEGGKQNH